MLLPALYKRGFSALLGDGFAASFADVITFGQGDGIGKQKKTLKQVVQSELAMYHSCITVTSEKVRAYHTRRMRQCQLLFKVGDVVTPKVINAPRPSRPVRIISIKSDALTVFVDEDGNEWDSMALTDGLTAQQQERIHERMVAMDEKWVTVEYSEVCHDENRHCA